MSLRVDCDERAISQAAELLDDPPGRPRIAGRERAVALAIAAALVPAVLRRA